MVAKWVPKCSKIGPETALKGDSDSKLKKEGAKSGAGAAGELRHCTNWRVLGPQGEGNREGADVTTRLTTLSRDKGSADIYNPDIHRPGGGAPGRSTGPRGFQVPPAGGLPPPRPPPRI